MKYEIYDQDAGGPSIDCCSIPAHRLRNVDLIGSIDSDGQGSAERVEPRLGDVKVTEKGVHGLPIDDSLPSVVILSHDRSHVLDSPK